MIKQTAEIFEILSKGGFISSDSTNPNIRQLYTCLLYTSDAADD